MLIVGVDTGGTFTDFIYKDGNSWGVHKRLSTPHDPSESVINGLKYIAGDRRVQVVHGSTVATNAILERKGVKTALISNEGFEDIVQIGRQNRSELYNLSFCKKPHIVPPELRFGITGRIDHNGNEVESFSEDNVQNILKIIKGSDVESVAICLLFSYLNPEHENRMRSLLSEIDIPVSVSHEILAEFREFERTSTTVINAYVSPKMTRYLTLLQDFLDGYSLRIMQSNGGSISAETAMNESVRTILSGPAGGAVGAHVIGKMAGYHKLITFDMGGTSSDVALINGELPLTLESAIEDYPVKVPMIDIHTVGAGGGSIARIDAGGSLTVGPESAGADPGPICYGKGSEITVTDANLYLGRLIPDRFLGGEMSLKTDKLNGAMERMAAEAGLSPVELAEGILDIANTNMERAIRVISVERGYDPREFTMFAFGGAGGMHCAFLAKMLSIPKLFIPNNPGILSAVGMVMADVIKDYSLTVMRNQHNTTADDLENLFAPLEDQGRAALEDEGFASQDITVERFLDMRYQGQSFEIIVPFDVDWIEEFSQLHEHNYGYRNDAKTVEIVNIRLRTRGMPTKPEFPEAAELTAKMPDDAVIGTTETVFDSIFMKTRILDREKLLPGNKIDGPAIIIEYSSTLVIPPFAKGEVDAYGNLIFDIE
ncbi:hydantoinase/oxoprolinase family protein [Maridesulfovibrio ferrireducens]|uniref:hydantoinase/oxoprolinase family protein n=1 Tax=Maridesulfovibrio ferrireducens TaxID=246191 RepID=UPI001A1D16A7|nr:hydantoinase/oxoprolinase family protein [Maridesulfovibrio ferrireducens]MBI9110746.1 hydantoinase/oxoprolinase family protein [Maridesulfovibrio ferrireducens]